MYLIRYTQNMDERDELDELIDEAEADEPGARQRIEDLANLLILQHRLAERRRELKLTQQEVAEQVGTSRSALARIERGTTDCRISTLQRIAYALGGHLDISFDLPRS